MDYVTLLINAVISLLTIGGGSILFVRQSRRMKEVEVEAKQSDEWRKLFDQSDTDSRDKDRKIDTLYEERQQLYHKIIEKDKIIAGKDIMIERLKFDRCEIADCLKRHPPRKYGVAYLDNENEKNNPPAV